MSPRIFARIAARLMRKPAAPYFEHSVRDEVEKICAENSLDWCRDRFGNVIVRLKTSSARPYVLAAHLDHPGFEVVRGDRNGNYVVRFQGGVPERFFRKGLLLRLLPGGSIAKLGGRIGKENKFQVKLRDSEQPPPEFAVWEMEDFVVRGGRIHGRSCDDLVGVAAILAVLLELKRKRARVNVIGVISRAEEVGFRGALAVTDSGLLPKNSLVVSLETSRELPGVMMGEGVILRVGDKTSIFDTKAMRFLGEICAEQQSKNKNFRFQRGLMSGGTCEATAYQEFGFQTGAVCVALGNYHNCAAKNRIAAEFVSLHDACGMVDLLVAAARAMPRYEELVSKLPKRLLKMRREGKRRLKAR